MTAALMTQQEVTAAYRAALERKKTGRHQPYRGHTEAERRQAWLKGEELPKPNVFASEYREARDLGEWLDDQVLTWRQMGGWPEQPLVITLAEAARGSLADAVRVLRHARGLDPATQFRVYENLRIWRSHDASGRMLGQQLAAALLQEWDRLALPAEDPAVKPQPKRRRRPWEADESEVTA